MKPGLLLLALTCCALQQVGGSYYGEVGKRLLSTMQSLSTGPTGEGPSAPEVKQPESRAQDSVPAGKQAAESAREEPNKNEFVKLDTAQPELVSARPELANARPELISTRPELVTAGGPQEPASTQADEASGASLAPDADPVSTATAEPSTEGEPQTAEAVTVGSEPASSERPDGASSEPPAGPPQPENRAPPPEEVRETEQEAVAAVDASIGFGTDPFGALADACYDEYGNARFCEPPFENAAFERQVEASSECGSPPARFCTAHLSERNNQVRQCHMCDAAHPMTRHPAAYLTDMNNSNSPTCWVSGPISSASPQAAVTGNASAISAQEPPLKSDNVTLTLNLDKKYEIIYISMQFCSLKPDSLAIYKAADGRNWSAYQFYSSQCRRMYGRPAAGPSAGLPLEAQCANSSAGGPARVAFSTLEGRASGAGLDRSQPLQDWITASSIKIVLERHQPSGTHLARSGSGNGSEEASLTSPSDSFNYAVSDLTVGGRCKCNGHASRCVHSKEGRLQCDCRHNTAGRDCERCAPFHFDRPWARATQLDANPCQPCNCNGHSRKCRFDPELYRHSGKRSGGVCTACRDNTIGRHCQYCRVGFTRDHTKPMSDKEACKHCDCHPIGSLGPVCNQTSGQCPCKEGVAGLQCNRCSPGYQQSSSLSEPCIKLPENDINYEPSLAAAGGDESAPDGDLQASAEIVTEAAGEEARPAPPAGAGNNPEADDKEEADGELEEQSAVRRPRPPAPQLWMHQRKRRPPLVHRHPFELDEDQEPPPAMSRTRAPNGNQLDNNLDELDEAPYHSVPVYKPPFSGYSGARFLPDYRHHQTPYGAMHVRHKDRLQLLKPAMVGVDPGPPDGYAFDEDGYALGSMYGEAAFNQIQAAASGPHGRRRGGRPTLKQRAQYQAAATCADCQASTRRLSFRQFCHLDYAIKANIFWTAMADDWTRFDVELQDIFKSPASLERPAHSNSNYLDNVLADEPDPRASGANQTSPGESGDQHLRVGTKRSIWLPTEDLTCKCPKLKVGSTYLLMGSLDSKQDSYTALQLDRHGVALEWRAGLQERLVKYQRRHSRGRCN